MSLIRIRKRSLTLETHYHELGPAPKTPLRIAWAGAVIANPYAQIVVDPLNAEKKED